MLLFDAVLLTVISPRIGGGLFSQTHYSVGGAFQSYLESQKVLSVGLLETVRSIEE